VIAAAVANFLEAAGVSFELLPHERAETARGEAFSLGVPPDAVAKTVVLATPEAHVRAVVPASGRLDLRKVRVFLALEKDDLRLLDERELALHYPEFELGAVPPFGGRADRVLVDRSLAGHDELVLAAGSHDASLRMTTADLLRVTEAHVLDICQDG
jgi:prolyl-tRNA editing enzyme YbaK/EbsC (Cys-tRNA(Pro) deacylase)